MRMRLEGQTEGIRRDHNRTTRREAERVGLAPPRGRLCFIFDIPVFQNSFTPFAPSRIGDVNLPSLHYDS